MTDASLGRLSAKEIEQARKELRTWANPVVFRRRYEAVKERLSRTSFFTQAGLQFLRDAWVGAEVAAALSATKVRLCEGERPDFEIEFQKEVRQFEVTEADLPGRRRGEEYKKDVPFLEEDPVEDWRKRLEAIGPSVRAVIQKKIAKHYGSDVSLVIYVNLSCYGAWRKEGLSTLTIETKPAKDAFREIFVIWEGTLFSLWRKGGRSDLSWPTGSMLDV